MGCISERAAARFGRDRGLRRSGGGRHNACGSGVGKVSALRGGWGGALRPGPGRRARDAAPAEAPAAHADMLYDIYN
jgi:hypothetical protein